MCQSKFLLNIFFLLKNDVFYNMIFFLWCLCCALFSSVTHTFTSRAMCTYMLMYTLECSSRGLNDSQSCSKIHHFMRTIHFLCPNCTKWLREGLLQHSCHCTALHFCPFSSLARGKVTRTQEWWLGGGGWFLFGGNYLGNCRVLLSVSDITESDMPSSRQKQLSVVV